MLGRWQQWLRTDEYDFDPDILRLQQQAPSPMPRVMLWSLLALFLCLIVWALFGRLDIIATAQGKLVPHSSLKIVQPAESGIVKELLVSENDVVHAGQVVARMDTEYSDADGRALENELHLKQLQLRRVDAELAGEELRQQPDDPAEMFPRILEQYRAHRRAYLDALAAAQATRSKAEQDLRGALEVERKLAQVLPIYRRQDEAYRKLAEDGYAPELMASEKHRELIEREQDLRAQRHTVKSLRAAIEQADRQVAQIDSAYRQELQNERVQADGEYQKLRQEFDKQQHRRELLELKAPQDGIIKDLATHTPGTVVSPGTILMTVVPNEDPMDAEVWIQHIDAGFVREGQSARVKLEAYSFQKYGMLEGEVSEISPDAVDPEESKRPDLQGYRATVSLNSAFLENAGHRYRLTPGMQVTAEINLGSRSVLEYLLSPVRKAMMEAGRER